MKYSSVMLIHNCSSEIIGVLGVLMSEIVFKTFYI